MEEIWKDVVHYEELYEVSNLGRVRNKQTKELKLLRSNYDKKSQKGGYLVVSLWKNDKGRIEYVHRLVAMAFIPNTENKPQVDHIDTVITNNEVSNLRWVTHKENNDNELTKIHRQEYLNSELAKQHYKETSERQKGINNNAYKHPENNIFIQGSIKVRCIETGTEYNSCKEASLSIGASEGVVSHHLKNGCPKSIHGLHFEYINTQN